MRIHLRQPRRKHDNPGAKSIYFVALIIGVVVTLDIWRDNFLRFARLFVTSLNANADSSVAVPAHQRIVVALTREQGQNDKLRKLLAEKLCDIPPEKLDLAELPCIEHGLGPDIHVLEERLGSVVSGRPPFDCVVLTSPEAARVFLKAWEAAAGGKAVPFAVRVATVGKGTSKVVKAAGLEVAFEPSVANAETLAAELPNHLGPKVLYPASAAAQDTLQEGLAAQGFSVERLNTYTTQAVSAFDVETLEMMRTTHIATFGSPSAVKAWASHVSTHPIAACIGGTSSKAAKASGFGRVLAPEAPGLEGWADVVANAARELLSS